ncbi:alpha/beta hydrolase [Escherichia coli]|uniref:alpha/beta fold hydrolase n=1 Tax=Escherichia coli TaxID=562 RepID=UPI000BDEBBFE|nr:alpha/beta hydrolase [Escherichia coli]EFC6691054.1 alpha/beta hydrolase [Escherichia coli]MCN5206262.1 alpha/beta hydrolase [Escherichia coli]QIT50107.1 alpha/beta hydrolase [Escherichia coli]GCU73600.1 pimeloyl-ACP methyl ester carboxylesterase [Escherichia coli]HAH9716749.1 alpha/beta hydrolase [Escherichia coli]
MNFTFTDSGYTETNKNNPPIIFVHGFFMNNEMFKYQFDELKEKHRVVCINVRGFDAPSEKTEPFSLYDIVDDILNVADSLQLDKFILGGMSMGGYISLRFALSHPERLSGLILMATQVEQDPPEIASSYMELCNGWHNSLIKEEIISSLLPVFFGKNISEAEIWRQVWLRHKPENIKPAMNAMLERDDISDKVHTIKAPTLILHGSVDTGIPPEKALEMHKMIPHSELAIIPDANHALNVTHAKEVNTIIKKWLQKHTESQS